MTLQNDPLAALWMPFTANRAFKATPRQLKSAKDMHYTSDDGRQILDGTAGLWAVNAGHCRPSIVAAIQKTAAELDYAPPFQLGHPLSFELATRIADLMPTGLDRIFFTNSGSESVDTALKIALAYQRARGQGTRTRLIGRERGYSGVGFGGISVGGIVNNRRQFGTLLAGVDHLPHTHNLEHNAFTKGRPQWGAHLADNLESIVALHGAETIAAVIVEPMAGSTGVLVPPQGYLEKLREITTKHGILLIFDEVITGFGRMGAYTGAAAFGVTPDIMNVAKQITNGAQPLGAVIAKKDIYDTFMAQGGPDYMLEFAHGYTYSAHPVACAAGIAALDLLVKENMVERAAALAPHFENAVHSLKGAKHVLDIRNYGLAAGFTIAPVPGEPAKRPYEIAMKCLEKGFYVRYGGDTIQLAPPFIATPAEIDSLVNALGESLQATD
ncbi:MAG: aspartate aminotransferase family protein [Burkholderiales bacterium PBB4]|nr:MAG: aspartate aminotransferase family protein [Burkholderiales bacterium PBB4]